MKKSLDLILIAIVLVLIIARQSFAFWVWTPETGEWVNPKFAVKETPKEQLQYALSFYEAKKYDQAVREFNKLIKHYPRAREAAEAQYYKGKCWEDQGKLYEAFKNYQVVIDKYPFSDLAEKIVQNEYDLGLKMLEGQGRGKFLEAFAGTDYNVIDVFKAVIKNAPYGKLAGAAQYKIGLYLQEKELFQEARDEFEKVMNDYPNTEWARAAKYQIAISDAKRSSTAQYDQKVTQAAVKEFKEFVQVYPDVDLSQKAKEQIHALRDKEAENTYVVAQFYEKQKNYQAAKIYYQTVVDEFQDSRWASLALEKIQSLSQKTQ